jgi:hypothetical protein
MYQSGAKLVCESCAKAAGASEGGRMTPAVDPTVCSECGLDNGTSSLPAVADLPFCEACRQTLYEREFPDWLKLGLVGLALILAFAFVHGVPYFRIGWALPQCERLINAKHPERAIPNLITVAKAAPNCEKCLLLLAKAYLLAGNPMAGMQVALSHNHGRFKTTDLFLEVDALGGRANRALKLIQEANGLAPQDKSVEALAKLREARQLYPQFRNWPVIFAEFEMSAAFDAKDYDRLLAMSENFWQQQPDATSAGILALSLACKYAVTGDDKYRTAAEEMLTKGNNLAVTEQAKKEFADYTERTRYRLRTREILSKKEYYLRFPKPKEEHP